VSVTSSSFILLEAVDAIVHLLEPQLFGSFIIFYLQETVALHRLFVATQAVTVVAF
jgi:hypothetical protein